jgi:solute carrier family 25 aspartate/glutamate transporter 12/13
MEAAIVFHFAGRGGGTSRLALVDFAQLLNPKWKAPQSQFPEEKVDKKKNLLNETLRSAYNFVLGGMLMNGGSYVWVTYCTVVRCGRGMRCHGGVSH